MDTRAPLIAVGADGAPRGWLVACLYADSPRRAEATSWDTQLELVSDLDALSALRAQGGARAAVAIDVPIGLLDTVDFRDCDIEARKRLGARRNSVFAPPARYMLAAAGDYTRIRELVEAERSRNPAAKSISAQAAGIAAKIRDVDDWVRAHPESEQWLWECHPELSFLALSEGSPLEDKHRAAGVIARLRLLRAEFGDVEDNIANAPWPKKEASLSDILDAYAALSTALRCARGEHEELGNGKRDARGVPMRMAV